MSASLHGFRPLEQTRQQVPTVTEQVVRFVSDNPALMWAGFFILITAVLVVFLVTRKR